MIGATEVPRHHLNKTNNDCKSTYHSCTNDDPATQTQPAGSPVESSYLLYFQGMGSLPAPAMLRGGEISPMFDYSLVNRSQFVSPGKVRQGHIKTFTISCESHERKLLDGGPSSIVPIALPRPSVLEPLWTAAVRYCQRRGYKRFSVPHMFLHHEGQGGRTSAAEQR
ncbi:hypothetical protein Q1695_000071 [Nippostrongylus brasiliensis]|nr:hypothetical protein Q1695_000071 [Nippostrongylus brasiliensis]